MIAQKEHSEKKIAGYELFNAENIRKDFPILSLTVHGKPLVYLDNAATTQKPAVVIDAVQNYYLSENANVHRGVHALSELATNKYEGARETIRKFIHAGSAKEIIFTRGASESINLVAATFGKKYLKPGDEVIITGLEHHSNIVPWQLICEERGAKIRVVPITDSGEIVFEDYKKLLSEKVKIVAVSHISNALGTVNPVREIIDAAHRYGIPVLVDGAQGLPHVKVDVKELDVDFYAFSSHKIFGPTGFGVLYGKEKFLEAMPPYQGGGDMIRSVTFEKTLFNDLPYKFEAGTPHIAGAVGFGAALEYLATLDWDAVVQHEQALVAYATEQLEAIKGVKIIGTAKEKAGVVSFVIDGIHPHDIGTILDQEGIAIRTGHHCAQPVMDRFGISATARASFAFYNMRFEVDVLARGIQKVKKVFGDV